MSKAIVLLCLVAGASADPREVQLAITEKGKLRVSWKTDSHTKNTLVYSDLIADPSRLQKQGTTVEAAREYLEHDVYLHFVEFQDELSPQEIYIYQCGNSETGWSPVYSFRSPSVASTHFPTFAVLGSLEASEASQKTISQLSARCLLDRLDLVFHFTPGPLPSIFGLELLRAHIPFVPVLRHTTNFTSFHLSGVAFIFVDTEDLTPQLQWFRSEVAQSDVAWTVVMGKDPPDSVLLPDNQTLAEVLTDCHAAMYINSGKAYERQGRKYSKNYGLRSEKRTDTFFISEGPLRSAGADTKEQTDFFSFSGAGYALLHVFRTSYLHVEQYSAETHRLVDEVFTYRQVDQLQVVEKEDILAVSLVGLLLLSGVAVIATTRCIQRHERKLGSLPKHLLLLPKTLNIDDVEDLDSSNVA